VTLEASRLRAGLIRMYDLQVVIVGAADEPGLVLVPRLEGGMHGGRVAGSAVIRAGDDGEPVYWANLHVSGVRASPVFDDLLLPPEGLEGPPIPGQTSVLSAWSKAEDLSRGALLGNLTLTGPVGDPGGRQGRGLLEISGGKSVLSLPGLINLIEASNLSLPTGAQIDIAEGAFYIDGRAMVFERLIASSRKIEIIGYGTLDWETREIDLRFSSRAQRQIPVLSELLEELRDELITTRVTGTLGELNFSINQFASTRRLINALLGRGPTEQERRMRSVEEQAQVARLRDLREDNTSVQQPDGSAFRDWDWGDPSNPEPRREGVAQEERSALGGRGTGGGGDD